jgi:hypothetical protein
MSYENDVYILDEETGEKIKDNETGKVLIKHKKGDLVKKRNGTPRFAERVIHPFCEISEIEII